MSPQGSAALLSYSSKPVRTKESTRMMCRMTLSSDANSPASTAAGGLLLGDCSLAASNGADRNYLAP